MPFDPRMIEFPEWAARTAQLLAPYGFVSRTPPESDWQSFARAAAAVPAVAAKDPVRPAMYTDWRSWAFKFNETVALLGGL